MMRTSRSILRLPSAGAVALALSLASCDRDDPVGGVPQNLFAVAGNDTIVAPDSTIVLSGSASYHTDGVIERYEWMVKGVDSFVLSSTGDTTISAPAEFDLDFTCVLRVTDAAGAVDVDTMVAIVSWIRSPNSGEVFHTGDSLRVSLVPVNTLVEIRLLVERDGELYRLRPPGFSRGIVPQDEPEQAILLPDSIYDLGGMVSVVSDSCRIQVLRYNMTEINVRSKGYFRIEPGP
jgi:hypothetical protein